MVEEGIKVYPNSSIYSYNNNKWYEEKMWGNIEQENS